MDCPFCAIIIGEAAASIVRTWDDVVAFRPLGPLVTPDSRQGHDGHLLVVPRVHVADAATDPAVTAATYRRAAELAADCGDAHLIANIGPQADQTVYHLHVHVIPRRTGDSLVMPWTDRRRQTEAAAS